MESRSTSKKSNRQSVKDETQPTSKRRGRPPKAKPPTSSTKPPTRKQLYKEETTIVLPDSNIEVIYVPPGIQQRATLLEFMVGTLRPLVLTENTCQNMKKEELHDLVFKEFSVLMSSDNQKDIAKVVGIMLLDFTYKYLLYELIQDCFPGLEPARLKEEVYVEIFSILIEEFNKNILGVKS